MKIAIICEKSHKNTKFNNVFSFLNKIVHSMKAHNTSSSRFSSFIQDVFAIFFCVGVSILVLHVLNMLGKLG